MPQKSNTKWYVLIGIAAFVFIALMIVLVVILLTRTTPSVAAAQCTYNGKLYDSGASIKATDGCNNCTCTNGSVSCTMIACSATPSPSTTSSVTPTIRPSITPAISTTPIVGGVKVYFGKPADGSDYTTLDFVVRSTDATGLGQVSIILNALLAGPTAAEKTLGFVNVMTLSGDSNCSGKSYQYSLTGTTLTIKFCKTVEFIANIAPGGSHAGLSLTAESRVVSALTQSLEINGINTVIIRQSDNSCYAKDTSLNASCTD